MRVHGHPADDRIANAGVFQLTSDAAHRLMDSVIALEEHAYLPQTARKASANNGGTEFGRSIGHTRRILRSKCSDRDKKVDPVENARQGPVIISVDALRFNPNSSTSRTAHCSPP